MSDDGAIWYLPDNGGQPTGPYTAPTILAKLLSGECNEATLCWREGMPDWQPVATVSPFAGALAQRRARATRRVVSLVVIVLVLCSAGAYFFLTRGGPPDHSQNEQNLFVSLGQFKAKANTLGTRTTLAGIGKACLVYADTHEDKLPPDLQTLVKEEEVSPASLESKRKPTDFHGPSFIYIPGQSLSMPPDNVLAYENPEFCTDDVCVLFLDSHEELLKPEAFRAALKSTCERLGRPMPKIRFKGGR